MFKHLLLALCFIGFFVTISAQEYINNHERIYETGNYEKMQKRNYLIKPLYSNYIEVTGFFESGDEMIVVKPNTILKPDLTLSIYQLVLPSLQGNGGESIGDIGRSSRQVSGILSISNNGNILNLKSSKEKIIGYVVYNSNGVVEMNRTITPTQQEVDVNISWLPVGIYYVYAIFEDNTYESKRFQK